MSRALAILAIDEGIAKLEAARAFLVADGAEQPTPAPSAPVAPAAVTAGLQKPDAFFQYVRRPGLLGPTLEPGEAAGCQSILAVSAGVLPLPWCAYALATAHWETGGAMAPNVENLNYTTPERLMAVWPGRFPTAARAAPFVRNAKGLAEEVYGGRADLGNTEPGDGWRFRGRGQGHLTGRRNYALATERLRALGVLKAGESLVEDPDLALRPDVAAAVLVFGMRDGWFTGKRLNDFINNKATAEQFAAARRIVNPDRNGAAVAALAAGYLEALKVGGWG